MGILSKKKAVVDLLQYRDRLESAGVKNAEISNTVYVQLFSIITTTALAELAFLGAFELSKDTPASIAVMAASILIVSLVIMGFGLFRQKSELSRASKHMYSLSSDVDEYIKDNNENIVDDIPEELRLDATKLTPSRVVRSLVAASFVGIGASSVLIIVMLWGRV